MPLRASLLVALAATSIAAVGCKRPEREPPRAEAPAPPPAPAPAPAQAPAPPPPTAAPPEEPAATAAKPGWSEVSMQDDLPLCVFSSFDERESTTAVAKAKKQTLSAGAPLVFGVFEPWCLNPACDERMLLQCWVERAGNTLTVHTRFAGQHKDGPPCTGECLPVLAACQSPPLEAGSYTIRHGDKTHPVKIPGVMRAPCFDAPTPRRSRTAATP